MKLGIVPRTPKRHMLKEIELSVSTIGLLWPQ